MSSPLLERIAGEHAASSESLGGSAVARARRRRALNALLAAGLPTARDENWRYANLRPLERVRFAPAAAARVTETATPLIDTEWLPASVPGFARYVFIDGVYAPRATSAAGAQLAPTARVSVGVPTAPAEPGESPLGQTWPDAFALLNDAFATDGLRIEVDRETGTPARIEVVFIATASAQSSAPPSSAPPSSAAQSGAARQGASSGQPGASYPRLSVVAGPGAHLELIERHVSFGDEPSFVNSVIDVRAQEGSRIEHHRLQQLGARALCIDTLAAAVAPSAVYRLHAFALGAQSARSTLNVRLAGEDAELALHAVAAADKQQVLDTHAVVEHAAPHTRTDESFRGVAAGRSRVAFNGKIIVQPGSRGADSSQSLRGLLAGAEAEIDVRPQLEIYTDDVRCSHGATAGKLDEGMLFYLLSRGLDRQTAQRLLKWAFLEDVVSKVAVAELRRQIEASLAGQLQETEALKELL